ncbi:Histone-lysine N-methyltransferase ASHR2 [Bienertia sinuspersici]
MTAEKTEASSISISKCLKLVEIEGKGRAYNLATTSPREFEELLSLHGDGKGRETIETAMFLHPIIMSTLSFEESSSTSMLSPTVEMTAALLDKESCNSFSLMEPYSESGIRSARAYSMYKNASFFNHDCLPNACRFDYIDSSNNVASSYNHGNTDIMIRMIHDVQQGEEVCLSYFRVGLSYHERRRRLVQYFGFTCFCDRCKIENDDGIVEMKHERNECDNDENNVVGDYFARLMCERENWGDFGSFANIL